MQWVSHPHKHSGRAFDALRPAQSAISCVPPEAGQRKQRDGLGGVPLQTAIAHVHMIELALDHPERLLELRAYAGLELPDLVDQRVSVNLVCPVQHLLPAQTQGDAPVHAQCGIRSLGHTLIAGIDKDEALLPVHQAVSFDYVVHVT